MEKVPRLATRCEMHLLIAFKNILISFSATPNIKLQKTRSYKKPKSLSPKLLNEVHSFTKGWHNWGVRDT